MFFFLSIRLPPKSPRTDTLLPYTSPCRSTIEYLPMVEKALQLSATPAHTVIVKNREQIPGAAADYESSAAAWFDWDELIADATAADPVSVAATDPRSEEHTSELQSLMRNSYAVICFQTKNTVENHNT